MKLPVNTNYLTYDGLLSRNLVLVGMIATLFDAIKSDRQDVLTMLEKIDTHYTDF